MKSGGFFYLESRLLGYTMVLVNKEHGSGMNVVKEDRCNGRAYINLNEFLLSRKLLERKDIRQLDWELQFVSAFIDQDTGLE